MDLYRRKALGCVVALVLCGASAADRAGPPDEVIVTYRDLDLNTHDGVAAMYARLEAAARTVCAAHEGSRSHDRISWCVDYSVRQAVVQIGAPRLAMLYEIRTGHAVVRARR